MSTVNDVLELIATVEGNIGAYISYDSFVGGLVSRSLKTLSETRAILQTPTSESIREAEDKIQGLKEDLGFYISQAPEVAQKIDEILNKLKTPR